MAKRKPWWVYVREVFVRSRTGCVTATKSNGDIHCVQKGYSWLLGPKTFDCGDDCLP